MASYTKALTPLLRLEGGYANDEDDYGGETNFGISRIYWPEYWEDGPPDEDDAREFYAEEFWKPMRLGEIHYQPVANEMLDQAVNYGPRRATRFLQWAINTLGQQNIRALRVDGIIGPKTLDAVNRLSWQNSVRLVKLLNGMQFAYYTYRVDLWADMADLFETIGDPSQEKFYRGWLRRIDFEVADDEGYSWFEEPGPGDDAEPDDDCDD